MRKTSLGTAVAILLLVATSASAEDRIHIVTQHFRLSPSDGCFHYRGAAEEFVGYFRAGSYVSVDMHTLNDDGSPVPTDEEQRRPVMDAPDAASSDKLFWFGPLPASRAYSIEFSPEASWGSIGLVTICGRTTPPR